jgi:hypothetical protein
MTCAIDSPGPCAPSSPSCRRPRRDLPPRTPSTWARCPLVRRQAMRSFRPWDLSHSPACNAKRAHVTAMHLVERVLPRVPYRQWTLSFPHCCRAPEGRAAFSSVCLKGLRGLSTERAHGSGGPCQRPSSAPALLPATSQQPFHPSYAWSRSARLLCTDGRPAPRASSLRAADGR